MYKMGSVMIKVFLLLITLNYGTASASSRSGLGVYLLGQAGYFSLQQKAAVDNSVEPSAVSSGGGIGLSLNRFELEASFISVNAEAALLHDSVINSFLHKQSSYTLALNFYLFPIFYLRAGYSYHSINQSLAYPIGAASQAGAVTEYGLQGKTNSAGFSYGGGLLFYKNESGIFTAFIQLEKLQFSSFDAGALNTSIGFRFYIK